MESVREATLSLAQGKGVLLSLASTCLSLASTCQRRSYADDTGIYLAFNPNDDSDQEASIAAMEACLCDIRSWMINDKLMINDSKTEFMLIGTKAQLQKTKSATLAIGKSIISPSTEPLRNLGAWFDCHFNLNSQADWIIVTHVYTDYPTAPSLNCSVFKTQLQEFYI